MKMTSEFSGIPVSMSTDKETGQKVAIYTRSGKGGDTLYFRGVLKEGMVSKSFLFICFKNDHKVMYDKIMSSHLRAGDKVNVTTKNRPKKEKAAEGEKRKDDMEYIVIDFEIAERAADQKSSQASRKGNEKPKEGALKENNGERSGEEEPVGTVTKEVYLDNLDFFKNGGGEE